MMADEDTTTPEVLGPDEAAAQIEAEEAAAREREAAEAAAIAERLTANNATAAPVVTDEPTVVMMATGPTLFEELAAAGFGATPLVVSPDRVQIAHIVQGDDLENLKTVLAAHDPTKEVMARARQAAFKTAMDFGNSLTAQITGQWSDVEARSWVVQEQEARLVAGGGTLPPEAILPPMAADKGETVEVYAASVIANADQFRQIAVAGVRLRRAAEGLLSEELDTPEKLKAAVDALMVQAKELAAQFGITV